MGKDTDNNAHRTAPATFSLPDSPLKIAGSSQQATFVIGAPRSGTTLLYKLACLHPDAAWISNYVRRAPQLPQLSGLNRLATRLGSRRDQSWFGEGQAYRYGDKRPMFEWLFPAPVEGEPFFRACGLPMDRKPSPVSEIEQERRLRVWVRTLCKTHGADHFVSKRIAHNQRLPVLASAFPNARFVHLVRDGRDVARSLRKVDWWPECYLPWYGATSSDWEKAGNDPWEAAARHWVEELNDINAGLETIDPARVLQLRYEDFLAEPTSHLEQMGSFMNLSITPTMAAMAGDIARPGDRKKLDDSVEEMVSEIQNDYLIRYRYEAAS